MNDEKSLIMEENFSGIYDRSELLSFHSPSYSLPPSFGHFQDITSNAPLLPLAFAPPDDSELKNFKNQKSQRFNNRRGGFKNNNTREKTEEEPNKSKWDNIKEKTWESPKPKSKGESRPWRKNVDREKDSETKMNTEENNEQNEKILTQKVENDRDDTKPQLHTSDEKNIQRQDSQPKSQQKKATN